MSVFGICCDVNRIVVPYVQIRTDKEGRSVEN